MSASPDPTGRITRLLEQAGAGEAAALDQVFTLVYDELQILARRQRSRWHGDPGLETTAVVHEAYLKLVGRAGLRLRERGHFFALASRAMRQILCNAARDGQAAKRGGGAERVTLTEGVAGEGFPNAPAPGNETLLVLDEVLRELDDLHPRAARVVECRFFGGMTVDETAVALEVSGRTVKRDWEFAQAWLRARMEGDSE